MILKSNYKIIYFLLLFLLLFFFFYNPYPSRTRNSSLLYKNPSSVCQPYIYLLKSERRKWIREIWTKRHKNERCLHLLFLNTFNVQKEARLTILSRTNHLLFVSYNPKSCLDLFVIQSSTTCLFTNRRCHGFWRHLDK